MAFDFKEILVSALIGTIATVEKGYVDQLIAKLKEDETPEDYVDDLKAGYLFFKRISKLAAKSKTNIDDTFVGVFLGSITQAAALDGIVLE